VFRGLDGRRAVLANVGEVNGEGVGRRDFAVLMIAGGG
jgi:hypothetical protein